MEKLTVTANGVNYTYEFDEPPTEAEINAAMEHIGGRPNDRA